MLRFPVIDLHCDLLLYLAASPRRSPHDLASRCAVPQLRLGGVKVQTLAIFAMTERGSVQAAGRQVLVYQQLPHLYPHDFIHLSSTKSDESAAIATLMAFENASSFCGEEELLSTGLERLEQIIAHIGKPLYIGITWNTENRFGGGALTSVGLKEDGRKFLDWLHNKNIAVDLSHASDPLAYQIIDFIEGRGLEIPLMASHSNSRSIASVPRNLPDDIAKEIFRRGGIVGMAFCHHFVGGRKEDFAKHIAHWIGLGGEDCIAFGADFFYEKDLPRHLLNSDEAFFPECQNASCYPEMLNLLQRELSLSDEVLQKLAYKNASRFIQSRGLVYF